MCHITELLFLSFADRDRHLINSSFTSGQVLVKQPSSMTSPSYGKLSNCTLVKIWLVFILGVGTFTMEPVLASFIRFKADTEYVYNFQASTEMKTVERLLAKSKVMIHTFKFQTLNTTLNSSFGQHLGPIL